CTPRVRPGSSGPPPSAAAPPAAPPWRALGRRAVRLFRRRHSRCFGGLGVRGRGVGVGARSLASRPCHRSLLVARLLRARRLGAVLTLWLALCRRAATWRASAPR